MRFDYSPFNPLVWGAFIAAWGVIWFLGNAYRKAHFSGRDKDAKEK